MFHSTISDHDTALRALTQKACLMAKTYSIKLAFSTDEYVRKCKVGCTGWINWWTRRESHALRFTKGPALSWSLPKHEGNPFPQTPYVRIASHENKKSRSRVTSFVLFWWTRRDSNPRPPHCERGALPAELLAHGVGNGVEAGII